MTVFRARPLALGVTCYLAGLWLLLLTEAALPILAVSLASFVLFAILAAAKAIRKKTAEPTFSRTVLLSLTFFALFCRTAGFCHAELFPAQRLRQEADMISGEVKQSTSSHFTVKSDQGPTVYVSFDPSLPLSPPKEGDRIRVRLSPEAKAPNISFRSQGVLVTGYSVYWENEKNDTETLLSQLGAELEQALSPLHYADLAKAILLGNAAHVDPDFGEALDQTQTQHLLSVSGLHISVILMAFESFLSRLRLSRKLQAALLLLFTLFYMALLSFSPAVVRAGIMAAVCFLARTLRRDSDSLTSLCFAAAVLVSAEPFLLFDTAFQLSFLATLGIVKLFLPLSKALREKLSPPASTDLIAFGKALLLYVGESFLLSLSAILFTLPTLLNLTAALNLWTVFANLVLGTVFSPVLTAVLLFVPLQLLCSLFSLSFLSVPAAWICDGFLRLFTLSAQALRSLSLFLPLSNHGILPLSRFACILWVGGITLTPDKANRLRWQLTSLLIPLLLLIQCLN